MIAVFIVGAVLFFFGMAFAGIDLEINGESKVAALFFGVAVIGLTILLTAWVSYVLMDKQWEREAVAEGVAEYQLIENNGQKTIEFTWKSHGEGNQGN